MIPDMWPRIKHSFWANALLALAAVAVAVGAARLWGETVALVRERDGARAAAERLVGERAENNRRLAEYDTAAAVEREAKARLNLKKPGEVVVVAVEVARMSATSSPSAWWRRVIRFFGASLR